VGPDQLPVAGRYAQQLADDHHGQGIGEVADHVQAPSLQAGRQQLVDQLGDALVEVTDRGLREGPAHQLAEPDVLGRVADDADLLEEGAGRPLADRVAVEVGRKAAAQAAVAEQGGHVRVARDRPLARTEPPERGPLPQPGVGRVGVLDNGRVLRVEARRQV